MIDRPVKGRERIKRRKRGNLDLGADILMTIRLQTQKIPRPMEIHLDLDPNLDLDDEGVTKGPEGARLGVDQGLCTGTNLQICLQCRMK